MTMNANKQRAVLVLSTFALVVTGAMAGCGKKDEAGVASANPNATASSAAAGGKANGGKGFGKCMRDAGFSWFPDEDESGHLGGEPPAGVVVDDEKLRDAQEKCAETSMNNSGKKVEPLTAEEVAKIREYVKCLRANGLPNVPDANSDGIIDFGKAGVQDNTSEWKKAQETCEKLIPQRSS